MAHPIVAEATELLALVLYNCGRDAEANAVRRDLIQLHLDCGDIDAHLIARMDLAEQLHDAGRCDDAVRQATAAWQQWQRRPHSGAPETALMVLRLTTMLLACRRTDEALDVVGTADLRLPATYDDFVEDESWDVLIVLAGCRILHRYVCARVPAAERSSAPVTAVRA